MQKLLCMHFLAWKPIKTICTTTNILSVSSTARHLVSLESDLEMSCRELQIFLYLQIQILSLLKTRRKVFRHSTVSQSVSQSLTIETRVQSHASQCGICGGKGGTDTGFSPHTLVFPCEYNSIRTYPQNWTICLGGQMQDRSTSTISGGTRQTTTHTSLRVPSIATVNFVLKLHFFY
jgi:hypothetical protein